MYKRQIPDGMWVLHHCDNPPCVNPAHLFLGTHRDNMADMRAKGRGRFVNTWRPGEENRNARLSADQVVAIRRAYSVGEKQRDLAVRFGVSKSLVALITAGHIWKHIPTERPIAPRRAPGRRRRDRYVAATARSA